MKALVDKNTITLFFILFFNTGKSQIDTTFLKTETLKINDTTMKITQTVFNPEKGIFVLNELNKFYVKNKLVEENTSLGGKLNGLCKKYYSSGNIKELSNYVLGSRIGLFYEFFENGKTKCVGEYFIDYNDSLAHLVKPLISNTKEPPKNCEIPVITTIEYNQGLKNGKWLYFNENGNAIKEELWQKGKLIKQTR